MKSVIDYSWARPDLATLKLNGAVGVIRYIGGTSNKYINRAERASIKDAGLGLALVCEHDELDPLGGYDVGLSHGKTARAAADALGFPHNRPIYAAVDFDAVPSQLPRIREYFRGFNDAHDEIRQGAYGSGLVLRELYDHGLARWYWQTNARGWHGNKADFPQACLRQHFRMPFGHLDPGSIDVNDVIRPDWGQDDWVPFVPAPAPAPHPLDGVPMPAFLAVADGGTQPQRFIGDNGIVTKIGGAAKGAMLKAFPKTPTIIVTAAEMAALEDFSARARAQVND